VWNFSRRYITIKNTTFQLFPHYKKLEAEEKTPRSARRRASMNHGRKAGSRSRFRSPLLEEALGCCDEGTGGRSRSRSRRRERSRRWSRRRRRRSRRSRRCRRRY